MSLNKLWFAFGFVLLPCSPPRLLFLSPELLPSVAEGLLIPTAGDDRPLAKGTPLSVINAAGGFPEHQKTTGYYRDTTALFTAGSKLTDADIALSMTTNSLPLCASETETRVDGNTYIPLPQGSGPNSARTESPAKDRLLFNPSDPPHTSTVSFLMGKDQELS